MTDNQLIIDATSTVRAGHIHCRGRAEIGPGVNIRCEEMDLGRDVKIGFEDDDSFAGTHGVIILARRLSIGDNARIGRNVIIKGGAVTLGPDTRIAGDSVIEVKNRLRIAAGGVIHRHCAIGGRDIEMGRELRMLSFVRIGGGSAHEVHSRLKVGHWCHMGMYSLINTARAVEIGHEVGLGTRTAIYTHGAYCSFLDGFPASYAPVSIGDRCYLPGAVVNPGVKIGRDCVIAVGSVVSRDIPDGSLAGGVPAKVIRRGCYPGFLTGEEKKERMLAFTDVMADLYSDACRVEKLSKSNGADLVLDRRCAISYCYPGAAVGDTEYPRLILVGHGIDDVREPEKEGLTVIDLDRRTLRGVADPVSQRYLNQLRRYGVRFPYSPAHGMYQKWDDYHDR